MEFFGKRSGATEDCSHAADIVGGSFRALGQHYDYWGCNLEIRDLVGLDCAEEVCVDKLFHYVDLRANNCFSKGCFEEEPENKFFLEMREMTQNRGDIGLISESSRSQVYEA